jgi:hypothetical protein
MKPSGFECVGDTVNGGDGEAISVFCYRRTRSLSSVIRRIGHFKRVEDNGLGDGGVMKSKRENRTSMREGDRILINKGISKKVFVVARVDIPHSNERVFVSKSGGKYTIGLKVWRSDYAWSEKNQMWVPKR